MNDMPKEITEGYKAIQTEETIETVTHNVWTYYAKLIEKGFTVEQAFELTKMFQESMLTIAANSR